VRRVVLHRDRRIARLPDRREQSAAFSPLLAAAGSLQEADAPHADARARTTFALALEAVMVGTLSLAMLAMFDRR
jgi:hypothetical protein